jgi:hypothetical protein
VGDVATETGRMADNAAYMTCSAVVLGENSSSVAAAAGGGAHEYANRGCRFFAIECFNLRDRFASEFIKTTHGGGRDGVG